MTTYRKLRLEFQVRFETPWHLGSGRPGERNTDAGVLLDARGLPVLPGSSLKGKARATLERLAPVFGLSACMLDSALSGVECFSDEKTRRNWKEEWDALGNEAARLAWLNEHTCDVCKLFGSPGRRGRIAFGDGILVEGSWPEVIEIRDGVCLDRDSETARDGLKFDYEIVPAGTRFKVRAEVENPEAEDLALLGVLLREWEDGIHLGGKTTRGLGQASIDEVRIEEVDYGNAEHRRNWLLRREWAPLDRSVLDQALEACLAD